MHIFCLQYTALCLFYYPQRDTSRKNSDLLLSLHSVVAPVTDMWSEAKPPCLKSELLQMKDCRNDKCNKRATKTFNITITMTRLCRTDWTRMY